MAIWTHERPQLPGNGMIFWKGISGGPAPLSEAVSSHASRKTEANGVKMFGMPTPCVHLSFKPKLLKIQSYTKLDFLLSDRTILLYHPVQIYIYIYTVYTVDLG